LLLKRTIYGTKQAAKAFYLVLLEAFRKMAFHRSKADPCLHYAWTSDGLVLWISWVDDMLVCGSKAGVTKAKQQFMTHFDVDDVGELKEFVGCKIDFDREKGEMKLTQPVLVQSFTDEFELPKGRPPDLPAPPGEILLGPENPKDNMPPERQTYYRSGVGKLLHLVKWSRPEILNSVRELSRFMTNATIKHLKAMHRALHFVAGTPDRGLILKPYGSWDGSPNYEFVISGEADANYATHIEGRRSVSGYAVYLNGAPIKEKSRMQNCVTLSVTESELVSGTECAQHMLRGYRVLKSKGLRVKLPMILWIDNRGAVDLSNNWSVGGRTRHMDVRYYFLRELKEEGLIHTMWKDGANMSVDLFTKNVTGPLFDKHSQRYVG
jgi:Reverse transcriptase (RNA-dependent DNA polymerase)